MWKWMCVFLCVFQINFTPKTSSAQEEENFVNCADFMDLASLLDSEDPWGTAQYTFGRLANGDPVSFAFSYNQASHDNHVLGNRLKRLTKFGAEVTGFSTEPTSSNSQRLTIVINTMEQLDQFFLLLRECPWDIRRQREIRVAHLWLPELANSTPAFEFPADVAQLLAKVSPASPKTLEATFDGSAAMEDALVRELEKTFGQNARKDQVFVHLREEGFSSSVYLYVLILNKDHLEKVKSVVARASRWDQTSGDTSFFDSLSIVDFNWETREPK